MNNLLRAWAAAVFLLATWSAVAIGQFSIGIGDPSGNGGISFGTSPLNISLGRPGTGNPGYPGMGNPGYPGMGNPGYPGMGNPGYPGYPGMAYPYGMNGGPMPYPAGGEGEEKKSKGKPSAGPWYLYWPLEAHFQNPAPGWPPAPPRPMMMPPSFYGMGMGMASPYPMTPYSGMMMPQGGMPSPREPAAPASPNRPDHLMPYEPTNVPANPGPSLVPPGQPVGFWFQQVPTYWYGR